MYQPSKAPILAQFPQQKKSFIISPQKGLIYSHHTLFSHTLPSKPLLWENYTSESSTPKRGGHFKREIVQKLLTKSAKFKGPNFPQKVQKKVFSPGLKKQPRKNSPTPWKKVTRKGIPKKAQNNMPPNPKSVHQKPLGKTLKNPYITKSPKRS